MLERKKLPRGEEQCDFSKLLLHSQSLADYSSKNATRDLKFNKSSLQSSQSNANSDKQDNHSKQRSLMKLLNSTENKLYHEYLTLKNANQDNGFNKIKIAHIFNIQAINLINKSKCEYKAEVEKNRNQVEQANLRAARPLRSPISKEMRKRQ